MSSLIITVCAAVLVAEVAGRSAVKDSHGRMEVSCSRNATGIPVPPWTGDSNLTALENTIRNKRASSSDYPVTYNEKATDMGQATLQRTAIFVKAACNVGTGSAVEYQAGWIKKSLANEYGGTWQVIIADKSSDASAAANMEDYTIFTGYCDDHVYLIWRVKKCPLTFVI